MYRLPDVVVEKGHPSYSASEEIRHHTFDGYPLLSPELPLVVKREVLVGGADFGHHQQDDYYSLWVSRSGRGIRDINDHLYGIRRGDVYMLPPGGIHGYRDYENIECDAFYFQSHLFSPQEMAALQELTGFWDLFVPAPARDKAVFRERRLRLTPEQHHEVNGIISAIRAEMTSSLAMGGIMAPYRFFCLLGLLARWHTADVAKKAKVSTAKKAYPAGTIKKRGDVEVFHAASLAQVVQYCDENFTLPLTVEQLAARMCLSPNHFTCLFVTRVGMPPARYLRSLRLERAQALLRDSDNNITQIARQVAFANGEHLAHAFRAAFGISPSEYRKSHALQKSVKRQAK
jgi:AraC-like DNA-binding protein